MLRSGLNVPPPPFHVPVDAPPLIEPANGTEIPEQIVWGGPALTVGAGFTVMVLVALTAEQPAGALVVSVKVTVPLKLAAGV